MRVRPLAFTAVAVGTLSAAFACTDLFHSTDDFKNLCDVDAATLGCDDICTVDSVAAKTHAENVCALLGSCQGPIGENQYGECVFQATLAYDCNANPNRRPKGAMRAYWDCVGQAGTCADIQKCLFPKTADTCADPSKSYSSCADDTRAACSDGGASAEGCAATGRQCAAAGLPDGGAISVCSAAGIQKGTCSGAVDCIDASIRDCSDAGDNRGVDCANFGGQRCVVSAIDGGSIAACVPQYGAACAPTDMITCKGDFALGCPTGMSETVDCAKLTGTGSCHAGKIDPAWDVASACKGMTSCVDSCSGTAIQSCSHGKLFEYDCAAINRACKVVDTADGKRAKCVPNP